MFHHFKVPNFNLLNSLIFRLLVLFETLSLIDFQ